MRVFAALFLSPTLLAVAAAGMSVSIIDGFFWQLPENVAAASNAGIFFMNRDDGLSSTNWRGETFSWAELQPAADSFAFGILEAHMARARLADRKLVLRIPSSVIRQQSPWRAGEESYMPSWVVEACEPPWFYSLASNGTSFAPVDPRQSSAFIRVATPWDSCVQSNYKKFVAEFALRNYLSSPVVAGVYVHGISTSFGEELWLHKAYISNAVKAGMTQHKLISCFKKRISWWADAAQEDVGKLVWVGCTNIHDNQRRFPCRQLDDYALALGCGIRGGEIENFHAYPPPRYGQSYKSGYVSVDWSHPLRNGKRYFGDELENVWAKKHPRATAEMTRYCTESSLMRVVQLGLNALFTSPDVIQVSPDMFDWCVKNMAKQPSASPEAICWLREDYYRGAKESIPWKNFEHFLYQRDFPGASTIPVYKIERPRFYQDPGKDRNWDFTARRTDVQNGSSKMLFFLDKQFANSIRQPYSMIAVTYYDNTQCIWSLKARLEDSITISSKVYNKGDGKWKTAIFRKLKPMHHGKLAQDADIEIIAHEQNVTVRFVRVVR
jgi:hypothetical protein